MFKSKIISKEQIIYDVKRYVSNFKINDKFSDDESEQESDDEIDNMTPYNRVISQAIEITKDKNILDLKQKIKEMTDNLNDIKEILKISTSDSNKILLIKVTLDPEKEELKDFDLCVDI